MGYYIEAPVLHGKAAWLADNYEVTRLPHAPASFSEVPEDKALVMVIANPMFEAAGYVYSQREFDDVVDTDMRPREFLLMDKLTVELLSGYDREGGGMPDYRVKDPESVKTAVTEMKNPAPVKTRRNWLRKK